MNFKMVSKKIFTIILSMFSIQLLFSQNIFTETIAANGGSFEDEKVLINWTIGEPIIEPITNNEIFIFQGFHQDAVKFYFNSEQKKNAISLTDLYAPNEFRVDVYPNPASERINIKIENHQDNTSKFTIQLFNNMGRKLFSETTCSKLHHMNIDCLSSGYYILKLYDAKSQSTVKKTIIVKRK